MLCRFYSTFLLTVAEFKWSVTRLDSDSSDRRVIFVFSFSFYPASAPRRIDSTRPAHVLAPAMSANGAAHAADAVLVRRDFLQLYRDDLRINSGGCVFLPNDVIEAGGDLRTRVNYIEFSWRGATNTRRPVYMLHRVFVFAALPEASRNAQLDLHGSHLCRNKTADGEPLRCICCIVREPGPYNYSRHECHDNPTHRCDH